ncbi:hypothetical protein [Halolactibacillus sp. JCM 19043]|uniref:hypothetical protein n=1 Tax=Halolactibacillus sp. JCM 19043 TaxID=1460638 RepID=UPI0007860388|nr:hypothetical protein [Halolactibacillus sp. JCM 19043]
MNIQITNVSMRYVDGQIDSVQVHFNGQNDERTINLNGYIPLTSAQYAGNESLTALEGIVRQEVATKITN